MPVDITESLNFSQKDWNLLEGMIAGYLIRSGTRLDSPPRFLGPHL